jgi:tyrosine-protein kinase Etk/Wzc
LDNRTDWKDYVISTAEPESVVSEAYRNLRAKLSRSIARGKKKVMMYSTWAEDGKSTACVNLAVSLTQLHLRVALVDCDLRKPTISRIFELGEELGMTDFLDGNCAYESIFHPTGLDNLWLVPSGRSHKNPANLLGRTACAEAFDKLAEFDCVVVDTAPLSACGDAFLVAPHLDVGLLVVSPRNWDGEVEKRYLAQLNQTELETLGVVLNGLDTESKISGYGKGYGYGYGYGYGAKKTTDKSSKKKA